MKKLLLVTVGILFALNVNATTIPEGSIVKTLNNPDVYIVKYKNGKQFKRLVLNPQVFESYGHLKWEDILTISEEEINSFAESTLVKVGGENSVYKLAANGDFGNKAIVESIYTYDSDSVYTINGIDFGNYSLKQIEELAGNIDELHKQINETSSLYKVIKVVDGDTITVDIDGKAETLRLIGIDTPETVDPQKPVEYFGVEASNKAKLVLTGKSVRLEADSTQDERDRYGRLLRYVFLEDGTNFNKMMIDEGYAYEYTYSTLYKYQTEFKQAEVVAKELEMGLWGTSEDSVDSIPTPDPTPISGQYNCSSNVYNCTDFSTHTEAQSIYNSCGGASNDIHRLDADKDGKACESLP